MNRLSRLAPVTAISQELVRFDTQKLDNPEISGVEYQQGTLLGYEVREYLLEKWERECAYCGTGDTPLEIEHVVPRSRGGSDRVSNLTLSCHPCNQSKDALSLVDFFATDKGLKKRLKANGHKRPNCKHPKRCLGLMWNDPIINLKRKKRHGYGQYITHKGPKSDLAKLFIVWAKGGPKPIL